MTLNVGYLFFAWVYSCAELSFTYFLVLLQCLINIYKGLWHPVMKGAVQVFSSGIILLVKIQEESGGYQFLIQSEQWSHSVTLSRSCSRLFCNIPWESAVLWGVCYYMSSFPPPSQFEIKKKKKKSIQLHWAAKHSWYFLRKYIIKSSRGWEGSGCTSCILESIWELEHVLSSHRPDWILLVADLFLIQVHYTLCLTATSLWSECI